MPSGPICSWLVALSAVFTIGAPVAADDPPPAPADPELFEFLGELGGEEPLFILYTTSREAKKAAKDAATESDVDPSARETPQDAITWGTLDGDVQALLGKYATAWTALPPDQQHALAVGARRWLALDGIGRAQANERWQTWRSLTPEQRERVQKAWEEFVELTPAQQQAVRTAYMRFQELTPEQRAGLLEHLQWMSPEELRRRMNRRQGPKPGTEDKRPCPPC